MAREANNGHRMKLFTGLDKNNDPSEEEGHRMKLFTDQNDYINPHEEGGEGGMATLKEREEVSWCPNKHKYLFGIPVDEQIMKFSTGPRMGSSNISNNRRERDGYMCKSNLLLG